MVYVFRRPDLGVKRVILTSRPTPAEPVAGMATSWTSSQRRSSWGTSLNGGRGSVWGRVVGALLHRRDHNGMSVARYLAHFSSW